MSKSAVSKTNVTARVKQVAKPVYLRISYYVKPSGAMGMKKEWIDGKP